MPLGVLVRHVVVVPLGGGLGAGLVVQQRGRAADRAERAADDAARSES